MELAFLRGGIALVSFEADCAIALPVDVSRREHVLILALAATAIRVVLCDLVRCWLDVVALIACTCACAGATAAVVASVGIFAIAGLCALGIALLGLNLRRPLPALPDLLPLLTGLLTVALLLRCALLAALCALLL